MEKGGTQPNTTGHTHVLYKKVDSLYLLLHLSLNSLFQKFWVQNTTMEAKAFAPLLENNKV